MFLDLLHLEIFKLAKRLHSRIFSSSTQTHQNLADYLPIFFYFGQQALPELLKSIETFNLKGRFKSRLKNSAPFQNVRLLQCR